MEHKNKRRLIIGISLFLLLGFYLFKNLSEGVRIFGFIFGLFVFYTIDRMFEIDFKLRHYIYVMIILAAGILLADFYYLYESYDKILHFLLPILGGLLFFYVVDKQKLSFSWKLFITFLFIMTFLAFHEIGEYLLDVLWGWTLQGVQIKQMSGANILNPVMSRIDDTMIDLIMGALGTTLFVIGKIIEDLWKKKSKKH